MTRIKTFVCIALSTVAIAALASYKQNKYSAPTFEHDEIELEALPACEQPRPLGVVKMSGSAEQAILQGRTEFNVLMGANEACLKKGKDYPLVSGNRYQGRVRVTRIILVPSSALTESKRLALGLSGNQNTNDETAKTLETNSRVAVATLASSEAIAGQRTALAPLCDSCARVFFGESVSNLEKAAGTIVDLRHPKDYSRWHLSNAINLPFGDLLLLEGFEFDRLPSDKTAPLIFYTYDPADSKVLILFRELKRRGFENIQWVWDGSEGLQGNDWAPTSKTDDVPTISSIQFFRHLQKHTAAYFVGDSFDRASIPPSTNIIHFTATFDEETLRRDLNTPFSKGVRTTDLPANKTTPLVVFGIGPDDWTPFLAAKWLREAGWSHVYWYRGGLSEWLAARSHFDEIEAWSKRVSNQ